MQTKLFSVKYLCAKKLANTPPEGNEASSRIYEVLKKSLSFSDHLGQLTLRRGYAALFVLLLSLTAGVGNVWGKEATFVPSSASAGTLSGAPDGAIATFSNTYGSANQMTSGNAQKLTLSGFDGCAITGIKVHVKTNASSGGGSGTLKINDTEVGELAATGTIGGSYVDKVFTVTSTLVESDKTVVIELKASANSFYCDKFTITYVDETFTVTYDKGSGVCATSSQTQASIGALLTLPIAEANLDCKDKGWVFAGWSPDKVNEETGTRPTLYEAGSSYAPLGTQTLYAVYRLGEIYSVDFEKSTDKYADWTFTTMRSSVSGTISIHGGSYYGTTGGGDPAYLATKTKHESPKHISFYISKTTDNTTSSHWVVQISSDSSSWTDIKSQSACTMSKGEWIQVTQDLSDYNDIFVRIKYSGSSAIRAIDDLELSCATYLSIPDCTFDYFVDVMHGDGNVIKDKTQQGTYTMPEAPSYDKPSPCTYCEEKHYQFIGWVESAFVNEDGTLDSEAYGFEIIPAGTYGKTAANKTFYAVWGKEKE